MTGTRLSAILLRAAPARTAGVALLVAILGASLVAIPAWFGRTAARGLPGDLVGAGPGRVGLEWSQGDIATPAVDPLSVMAAKGREMAAALPPSLAAIAQPVTALLDTPEYLALDAPVSITRLAIRVQPDAALMTRITAGHAPSGEVGMHQVGDLNGPDGQPLMGRSMEVAISSETADELGLAPGDRLALMPGQNRYGIGVSVLVTGVFEVLDPADPRWFDDRTLASPVEVRVSSEVTIYHAVGLVDPGVARELASLGSGAPLLQYRWRIPLDVSAATTWDADVVAGDLARLQAHYPFHGSTATDAPGLATGLAEILSRDAGRRSAAGAAFALAAAGPLAAGLGLLAIAMGALADRRRPVLRLLRARGAGRGRLVLADLAADAALIIPAAGAGAVAGAAMAAGASSPATILLAGLVAGATGLAIGAGTVVASLRGPVTVRLHGAARPLLARSRARVATILLAVLAVLAAVALRTTAADGAAVAVPVLVAIAGGAVLARAVGLVAGAVARLAARGRGLALVHATRGLARGGGRGLLLVIIVLAVASGVLASVVDASLGHAQASAAATSTGADYRVAARGTAGLPADLDTGRLAALGPIAVLETGAGTLSSQTLAATLVAVTAVDPGAYAAVLAAATAEVGPQLGNALAAAGRVDGVGLVLRLDFASRYGLAPGSRISFAAGGRSTGATVVAVLSTLPGIDVSSNAVIPAPQLAALEGGAGRHVTVPAAVLLAAPPDDAAVEAAVADYRGQLEVRSRSAALALLRGAPAASAVRDGFAFTGWLAALLAALVTGTSMVAALGARVRDVAVLRAVGVTASAAGRLVLLETVLVVIAGLVGGVVLGLATAWLAMGDLGLERLAGVAGPVVAHAEPWSLGIAIAIPSTATLAAIALVWVVASRSGPVGRVLAEEGGR